MLRLFPISSHAHTHTCILPSSLLPPLSSSLGMQTPWLNGKHVVFGKVIEGQAVVDKLQNVQVGGGARPSKPVIVADCGLLA